MTPKCSWNLDGERATCELDGFRARFEFSRPHVGLTHVVVGDSEFANAALFGIPALAGSPPPSDAYCRVDDLIVTYPASDVRPLRTQVYFRIVGGAANSPRGVFGIEQLVSVQTGLLDSDPALEIGSLLPDGELIDNDDFVLLRLPGAPWSYAQIVHPGDPHKTRIERSPLGIEITHRLFAERLEKGVILRARIRGLFVGREGDLETARREVERFAAAELPLTT